MPDRNVKLLFALFALSGFSGLIYESVWSHYLKLFLGAAAFAQSFVLAAFMGGMALGAWLASRWSARSANLLALYGWIEAGIGGPALARPGDPGARLSGRGRGLQVFAVRPADRPADRTARHDFPAPLRGGDPPRARGARPSSGDALLHELDRRGRRSARWRVPADRLARNAGHDAVRRSAQPRSRRGGPRHRTPGRACRRRRAALGGLGSVREFRRPLVSRGGLRHRSRLVHLRARLGQGVVAGARRFVS